MNWIARLSTIFKIGDIVRVPFPFVEQDRLRARPALIISKPIGPSQSLIWSLMITSARRGFWPGDVSVGSDHAEFGLPVPCLIRTAKIAALPSVAIERTLGELPPEILKLVYAELGSALAWR